MLKNAKLLNWLFFIMIILVYRIGEGAEQSEKTIQPNTTIEHVVHISVDGLNASLLQALITNDVSGEYSAFQKLITEGAYTFNARTDYDYTVTLPNHTSMLTARPVLQPSGLSNNVYHGYISNTFPTETTTLHNLGNSNLTYVESVFDVVHDHGLSTGLYASKSKFILFEQSYNVANGAEDITGVDNGKDKIDYYANNSSASILNSLLADLETERTNYSFVHFADTDIAGHGFDWGSAEWDDAAVNVNTFLSEILAAIESDTYLQGRTIVIITSDHGGGAPSDNHHYESDPANYTIPLFAWGAGVAPNADLYALNPYTRVNPLTSRPSYVDQYQPLRNGETGTLALRLLGLEWPATSTTLMTDSMNLFPLADYSLGYTDGESNDTQVSVPEGGMDSDILLAFAPESAVIDTLNHNDAVYHSIDVPFELDAKRAGVVQEGFVFDTPATMTLMYDAGSISADIVNDVRLLVEENGTWVDASTTCSPTSTYTYDSVNNQISIEICHLSRYGWFAPTTPTKIGLQIANVSQQTLPIWVLVYGLSLVLCTFVGLLFARRSDV